MRIPRRSVPLSAVLLAGLVAGLAAALTIGVPAPARAQQYAQPAANQLMTLTAIGLAAQMCNVPMSDDTRKRLADGLERLGNSQTALSEEAYHQEVQKLAEKISGDLEHACVQINNQDLPSLIEKILRE